MSLLRRLEGHSAAVTAVSTKGDLGATASRDRSLKVWRLSTGALERSIETEGSLLCCSLSSTRVAAGGIGKRAQVWELETGKKVLSLEHDGWVRGVIIDEEDGFAMTCSDDKTAKIWKQSEVALILSKHLEAVLCVCIIEKGKWYATGSEDSTVRVFSGDGKLARVFRGHDRAVVSLASAGKTLLMSGSDDKITKWWDLETKKCVFDTECAARVDALAVSPFGTLLVAAGEVWSIPEQKRLLNLPHQNTKACAFFELTGTGNTEDDGDLCVILAIHGPDFRPILLRLKGCRESIIPAIPADYHPETPELITDESPVFPDDPQPNHL